MAQSLGEAVVEIGADLDDFDSDLTRGTRRAARKAETEGDAIGTSLSRGIGKGASKNDAAISTFGQLSFSLAGVAASGTGLISAIVPLPALLGGVVAGAVAVGGALGQAAGGALTAGTVLASFGLAAATVKVASAGLTDAFTAQSKAQEELATTGAISANTQKELDAAMKNLAPSARGVLSAVQALGPAWSALQKAVQGAFFQGVGDDIQRIGSAFLPVLRENLVGTAGVLNDVIHGFTSFITEGSRVQQIDDILGGLNSVLAAILPAVGNIARGLFALFGGTLGPAREMATAISDATAGFAGWAEGVAQSGELTGFLRTANSTLGTLVGIVTNVGSILVSVFGAGAAQGATLLSVFEQATGQLAAFLQTATASQGLQQFFGLIQQSGEAIRALGGVAVPIFQGIFTVIGTLLPHINALRLALLPVATVLGQAIGQALAALAPVIGVIIGLVVGLVQALSPLVSTVLTALGAAISRIAGLFMENLYPAISGLIPVLQPILGIFLKVFGAQVVNAINFIVEVLGGVFDILGGLITFLTGVFTGDWRKAWKGLTQIFDGVVKILTAAVKFLWNNIKNAFNLGIKPLLPLVRNWWTGITTSFTNFQVRIITGIISWVARLVGQFLAMRDRAIANVRGLWSIAKSLFSLGVRTVGSTVRGGLNNVIGFFRDLPGRITSAIGNLGSLLYNAGQNVVQGLIDGLASMLGNLAGMASNMASTIRDYLPFSPAKEGPLSGLGNPEESGKKIAQMVGDGITANVNLPAQAMQQALTPLAPGGSALAPLRRTAQPTSARAAAPAAAARGAGDVSVTQIFTGPTTSGGRLQEMNWNIRYATQARRETIGGVAR